MSTDQDDFGFCLGALRGVSALGGTATPEGVKSRSLFVTPPIVQGVCREAAMSAIREAGFGGNVAGGTPGAIWPARASDGRDEQNLEETMGQEWHDRAVVKHRHLLAASLAAAAMPGVSRAMVAGYERFGARC